MVCVFQLLYVYVTGRVINRFSKDIGFLDDLLPFESYQYTTVSNDLYIFMYCIVAVENNCNIYCGSGG